MAETITFSITIATIAQIALAVTLLASQLDRVSAFKPLIALLLALLCMILEPLLTVFFPSLSALGFALMLPAILSIPPLLWLYIEALTVQEEWTMTRRHRKHFVLPATGMVIYVLLAFLPAGNLESLLSGKAGTFSPYVGGLMIGVFILVICWTVQSGWYLFKILTCLTQYRRRLKDYFANTENRDLHWLTAYTVLLSVIWGLAALAILLDNLMGITLMSRAGTALMVLVLVWLFCFWGLRQHPGFEGHYQKPPAAPESHTVEQPSPQDKYQKSALDQPSAFRIANKIESIMQEKKLFLDPSISLSRLSEVSGVSPNYLSQTLNETLGSNFFDYVNGWRIKEAKHQLKHTEDTIITIAYAVGFNARSSFYKAFKEKTGVTPSQYRQSE